MPTKITLVVDNQTAEGFQAVARDATKAEKATGQLISKLSSFSKESTSMIGRLDRWSAASNKAADQQQRLANSSNESRERLHQLWKEGRTASQVFRKMVSDSTSAANSINRLGSSTGMASKEQFGMGKSTGSLTRGLLEASRGAEDFTSQLGTQGIAGGARAASNNLSQMAFVMGGPAAGAAVGAGIALGTVLLPALIDTKDEADNLTGRIDGLFGAFDRLSSGRAELQKLKIGGISQDEVAAVRKQVQEQKIELDVLRDKGNEIGKQIEAAKALKKLQQGSTFTNESGVLVKRSAEQIELLEQRAKGLSSRVRGMVNEAIAGETDHLEIQRKSNEVLDEFIKKSKEEFQSIEERGHAEVRLQKQREQFVAKNRNDGKALREEFRSLDEAEFKRKRDFAIQQSESQEDLNKALEKARKKQEDIRKELGRTADRNKLDVDERESGLKRIADLKQDEVKIERRLLQLKEEQERVATRINQQEMANAKRKHDAAVAEFQKQNQKQFAALQGGLAKSGFGGQVQQIAGGISQGEILRQTAKDRLGDTSGMTRGEESRAITREMKNLRMELAKGKLNPKELRNAQSKLIDDELSKQQKFGKVGIGNAFKQQQKAAAQSTLGGNVTGNQIQAASSNVVKSAASSLQQQGKLTKAAADGLNKAADAFGEQLKINQQQEQRLRTIEGYLDGVKESMRRQQSQRRGTRG